MQMYENLLETLAQRGIALPEVANHARHTSVDVYSSLVYCVVRASRCHLVGRLLDDMIHQGVARPLHFYESTMKQLAGVKRYKQALNVYERLAKDGLQPSPVTLSCLINFAVEVGELRRAINFFTLLASQTTPSIRAYMTVLRVHSMRQDWPSAIGIIYDMKGKGVPVDTLALNVALGTGIVADRLEEVEAVIQEAPQVDIVSYNTLLKGYAQRSDLIKAHQVFQSLLLRDLKTGTKNRHGPSLQGTVAVGQGPTPLPSTPSSMQRCDPASSIARGSCLRIWSVLASLQTGSLVRLWSKASPSLEKGWMANALLPRKLTSRTFSN